MNPKTAIIVPTLGTRNQYLIQTLNSIRSAGACQVLVIAPNTFDANDLLKKGLVDQVVIDPMQGLAAAINFAAQSLPVEIKYFNWLGDDDLLSANSIYKAESMLEEDESLTFVWGSCDYIDEQGNSLWRNRSGQWAAKIFRYGPNLIPQPGALIKLSSFLKVGSLSTRYKMAFDLDLFIKLTKIGPARFLDSTQASFRWHNESLSVAQRKHAVQEASDIRRSHLPKFLRPISLVWETPIKWATLLAGKLVSLRSRTGKRT